MQSHHRHMPTCITLKICTHQSMVEELETIGPVDIHRWWTSYAHVYFFTFGHKPRKLGRVKSCGNNNGREQIYSWYTVVFREVFKSISYFSLEIKKIKSQAKELVFSPEISPTSPSSMHLIQFSYHTSKNTVHYLFKFWS